MDYEYLSRIRAEIEITSRRKTSNILEGEFTSIYRGRSLDFDDLREYTVGDNVRDIDWKSSSKAGKILVRRYIAEKKHNILFLMDSGKKFHADTDKGENKFDIASKILMVLTFLIDKHGDDSALMSFNRNGSKFTYFKTGTIHMQDMLKQYNDCINDYIGNDDEHKRVIANPFKRKKETDYYDDSFDISRLLEYAVDNIRRKMIIFIVTDRDGISKMSEGLLRKATVNNDIMVINIEDAMFTVDHAFDVENNSYVEEFFSLNKKLRKTELSQREEVMKNALEIFNRYMIGFTSVSKEDEIIDHIVELFERNNSENFS